MLAVFSFASALAQADEPIKLALATTRTTSPATGADTLKATAKSPASVTNTLSLSIIKRESRVGLPAKTRLSPGDDLQPGRPAVVVITRNSSASGFFSGQSGNGSFGFANVEAGFGQAYDSDSIVLRGRNGTAWEETRYFFVKKVIRF